MAYAGGWQPQPRGSSGNGNAQNNSFDDPNNMNDLNADLSDFQSPLRDVGNWPNFTMAPLLNMSSPVPQFSTHNPMNNGQHVGMYSSAHQTAHNGPSLGAADRQGHRSMSGGLLNMAEQNMPRPPLAIPARDSSYLDGRDTGAWPSNSMSAVSRGTESYGFGHQSHQNQTSPVHQANWSAASSSSADSIQLARPTPANSFATTETSLPAMHVTSADHFGSNTDFQYPRYDPTRYDQLQVQPADTDSSFPSNIAPGVQSLTQSMNAAHPNFSPQHHHQPSPPANFYSYNSYLPPPSPYPRPQPSSPVHPSRAAQPPNVNNNQALTGFNNSSPGSTFDDTIRQRPNQLSQTQSAAPSRRPDPSSSSSNGQHNSNNMPASRKRTAATSSIRPGSSKRRRGPDVGADDSNKRICVEDDPSAPGAGDAKNQAALDKSDVVDLVDANEVPEAVLKQKEKEKNMQRLSAFQCVICMDDCKDLTVTSCGHLFCGSCIHESLHTSNAKRICPMCRQAIYPQTKIKGIWVALMKVKKIRGKGKQPMRRPTP